MSRVASETSMLPLQHMLAPRGREMNADRQPTSSFDDLINSAGEPPPPPPPKSRFNATDPIRPPEDDGATCCVQLPDRSCPHDQTERSAAADAPEDATPTGTGNDTAAAPVAATEEEEPAKADAIDLALLVASISDPSAVTEQPVVAAAVAADAPLAAAETDVAADAILTGVVKTAAPKPAAGPALAANGGTDPGKTTTTDPSAPQPDLAPAKPTADAGPAASAGTAVETPQTKTRHFHLLLSDTAGRLDAQPSDPAPAGAAPQGARTQLEVAQLASLQQPADRFGNLAAAAVQAPSPAALSTAAVSLAGLPMEIASRAEAGHNRFEIRLDPPELGRIDVRLDVDRSGNVTSRLLVDRAETLEHLRRHAGELERALQQAGLKTADNGLQFALRDHGFAGRQNGDPASSPRRLVVDPELFPTQTQQADYGRLARAGGGIDIRI
ncbi:MAG: flagellar hook-length control protein FliK [Alphaproteobacteria bacterium]|nr:flagellar hook-length control protein FliK [Alphaproteobacteria bacterium]